MVAALFDTLKLLLPALIPSWRFFDRVTASPRIEYLILDGGVKDEPVWTEFRPRPESLSIPVMISRMFWNPKWNESLFLVSCAERLVTHPTRHSVDEIGRRIADGLVQLGVDATQFQFRLVFIQAGQDGLERQIAYVSDHYLLEKNIAS